jgi:dihydrofolate reductase
MGKKTWGSIPARPLRNRANLILSSQPPETPATQQTPETRETPATQQPPETRETPATQQPRTEHWFRTMPDLFAHLEAAEYDEVWIIGGARIYEQFLAMHATGEIHIDEMCVTTMEGQFECDTFFPLQ